MKAITAILALLWAAANIVLAGLMIFGAFTAKTAAKEGILAQASLLLGGLLIAAFGVAVGLACLRMFAPPGKGSAA